MVLLQKPNYLSTTIVMQVGHGYHFIAIIPAAYSWSMSVIPVCGMIVNSIIDRICEKGFSTHIQFYELGNP